jgi:hypothetical protein
MMTQPEVLTDKIAQKANGAVKQNRGWIVPLGRLGYIANGVVYLLVGAQAAVGAVRGIEASLDRLTGSTWGSVALVLLVIGLAGYALWSFIQAIFDTENLGDGIKASIDRTGYAIVGLLYAGLSMSATRLLFAPPDPVDPQEAWTARLLSDSIGRWFVGAVGVTVAIVGVAQFYKALSADFRSYLKFGEMSPAEEALTMRVARTGFVARGVLGLVIGSFFVVAARTLNPKETKTLAEALVLLHQQPYGPFIMAIVALGLVAYGVFMLFVGRYRKMIRNPRERSPETPLRGF